MQLFFFPTPPYNPHADAKKKKSITKMSQQLDKHMDDQPLHQTQIRKNQVKVCKPVVLNIPASHATVWPQEQSCLAV